MPRKEKPTGRICGCVHYGISAQAEYVHAKECPSGKSDLAALMAYVDDAKIAAQPLGRVSGEPLGDFLRRLQRHHDALITALWGLLHYGEAAFQESEGEDTAFAEWDKLADAARAVLKEF